MRFRGGFPWRIAEEVFARAISPYRVRKRWRNYSWKLRLSPWRATSVKVTVTVDAADIDGRIKKTYKDFARKYNFPGFRKGKAPRPVIDNALGAEAVVGTVTEELLNGTWTAAIDEAKLAPVGGPVMETNEIVKAGEPYEYSFTIELRPEVELTSYEPVAIEMPFAEATDAEIDEQVEAMARALHRLRGRFRRHQDEAGELRRPHHEGHRRRRQRDRRAHERVPLCTARAPACSPRPSTRRSSA